MALCPFFSPGCSWGCHLWPHDWNCYYSSLESSRECQWNPSELPSYIPRVLIISQSKWPSKLIKLFFIWNWKRLLVHTYHLHNETTHSLPPLVISFVKMLICCQRDGPHTRDVALNRQPSSVITNLIQGLRYEFKVWNSFSETAWRQGPIKQ